MPTRLELREADAGFPMLAEVDDRLRRRLESECRIVERPAGRGLFDEEDACRWLPLMLEGSVKLVKSSDRGRELLLYRIRAGEFCVLTACGILNGARYPASGVAETPARALLIPGPLLRSLVDEAPAFRQSLLLAIAQRLGSLIDLVEELAFYRLDQRVAALLLRRGREAGGAVICATHQELADQLGSARELVSRVLELFENRGWLALGRGQIEVRGRAGLADFAGPIGEKQH